MDNTVLHFFVFLSLRAKQFRHSTPHVGNNKIQKLVKNSIVYLFTYLNIHCNYNLHGSNMHIGKHIAIGNKTRKKLSKQNDLNMQYFHICYETFEFSYCNCTRRAHLNFLSLRQSQRFSGPTVFCWLCLSLFEFVGTRGVLCEE